MANTLNLLHIKNLSYCLLYTKTANARRIQPAVVPDTQNGDEGN